jgi:hypothetical protein
MVGRMLCPCCAKNSALPKDGILPTFLSLFLPLHMPDLAKKCDVELYLKKRTTVLFF